MLDYLVIGKGMIGSAATRFLSLKSDNVALIGPAEPADSQKYQGVFGSYYDEGRITRVLSSSHVWATLAQRSIAEYRALEAQSGIPFYVQRNGVQAGLKTADGMSFIERTEAVGRKMGVDFEVETAVSLNTTHPTLLFPDECTILRERGESGYVNPRALVAAQCRIAEMQGATLISETVTDIIQRADYVVVKSDEGACYKTRKVLISAGAYSNSLLPHKLDLLRKPRTILMARLAPDELTRLREMPTVIYHDLHHSELESVYMLPPIQYPDGYFYLKMGGVMRQLPTAETDQQLLDWFHADGSQREANALQEVMFDIVPSLKATNLSRKACVVTATASGLPYIDTLSDNQIYVATGGNGSAAKSSNEIGRIAADLMLQETWPYDLAQDLFATVS